MRNPIRQLASSKKWQIIYNRAKECGSLKLFENASDLTTLQLEFLQWLHIYAILYEDMSTDEPFIDQDVIDDEILTDCYLYFRRDKNKKKSKKDNQKRTTTDSLVFRK